MFSNIFCQPFCSRLARECNSHNGICSGFYVLVLSTMSTEFDTLYHPSLRQDVFIKEEYHYLNVPRVGTYTVFDFFDCTFECLSNPSCLSLNLAASKGADGKLWCELLSSVKFDNSDEYKRNDTSHHFFIKVKGRQT